MSKQTAVEYLEKICYDRGYNLMSDYFNQAKEMEKEQMWGYIKKNYCIGPNSLEFHRLEFEQYYNETYKNEEK
jgi:hypothetical protein